MKHDWSIVHCALSEWLTGWEKAACFFYLCTWHHDYPLVLGTRNLSINWSWILIFNLHVCLYCSPAGFVTLCTCSTPVLHHCQLQFPLMLMFLTSVGAFSSFLPRRHHIPCTMMLNIELCALLEENENWTVWCPLLTFLVVISCVEEFRWLLICLESSIWPDHLVFRYKVWLTMALKTRQAKVYFIQ